MDAASELFYQNGYAQTSMEDIAAALSVTKPALYYHFESKEAILLGCVQDAYEQFKSLCNTNVDGQASGQDQLRAYLKSYLIATARNFGISLVLRDPQVMSEDGRRVYFKYRRTVNRELMQIVTLGISDGTLTSRDPVLTCYAIFGMFNRVAEWSPSKPEITPEEIYDHFISIILSGISGPQSS